MNERSDEIGSRNEPRNDEIIPAWEQVAEGRYMPRRVRGSCPGRELG